MKVLSSVIPLVLISRQSPVLASKNKLKWATMLVTYFDP